MLGVSLIRLNATTCFRVPSLSDTLILTYVITRRRVGRDAQKRGNEFARAFPKQNTSWRAAKHATHLTAPPFPPPSTSLCIFIHSYTICSEYLIKNETLPKLVHKKLISKFLKRCTNNITIITSFLLPFLFIYIRFRFSFFVVCLFVWVFYNKIPEWNS